MIVGLVEELCPVRCDYPVAHSDERLAEGVSISVKWFFVKSRCASVVFSLVATVGRRNSENFECIY